MNIFGLKFKDESLVGKDGKGITMAYPLCKVHSIFNSPEQFNYFMEHQMLDELVSYDLIFVLDEDNKIAYRTFVDKNREKNEDGTNKMDSFPGVPSSIESRRILQGLANWNDAAQNLCEGDYPIFDLTNVEDQVRKIVNK